MENDVMKFLLGEGPLDGVWFGDKHPTERGMFWWRKHLRQYITQNQPNCSNTLLCGEGLNEEQSVQLTESDMQWKERNDTPIAPNELLPAEGVDLTVCDGIRG